MIEIKLIDSPRKIRNKKNNHNEVHRLYLKPVGDDGGNCG